MIQFNLQNLYVKFKIFSIFLKSVSTLVITYTVANNNTNKYHVSLKLISSFFCELDSLFSENM